MPLKFLAGKRKYIFAQESFYLQGILDDINEQDTPFLDCNNKHMMKSGAPPDKFGSCTIWLPIAFHGFTSRINSKGYHSLVPGLTSIFLETVWVPLKFSTFLIIFTSVVFSACQGFIEKEEGDYFLHGGNLARFNGCTVMENNLVILQSSFLV